MTNPSAIMPGRARWLPYGNIHEFAGRRVQIDAAPARTIARELLAANRTLNLETPLPNWCLSSDPHASTLLPLIFLHIPKTAGSAIRLMLHSLFDQTEVAPLYNFDQYQDWLAIEAAVMNRHRLFTGHMDFDDVRALERAFRRQAGPVTRLKRMFRKQAKVITFLREPEGHVRSQAAFSGTSISNWMMLPDAFNVQSRILCGRSKWINKTQVVQTERLWKKNMQQIISRRSVANSLNQFDFVGIFEEMDRSLDLLSITLKLPPMKLPDLRLNQSGAVQVPDKFSADIFTKAKQDRRLLGYARSTFESKFAEAFGDAAASPQARMAKIELAYDDAVMKRLVSHWTVELSADRAWPARGLGLREANIHGQTWRSMRSDCTVLLKLFTGVDYVVSLMLHSATMGAMQNLLVSVNGVPLKLTSSSAGAALPTLSWALPAYCIGDDGAVKLTFKPGNEDPLSISSLRVYP